MWSLKLGFRWFVEGKGATIAAASVAGLTNIRTAYFIAHGAIARSLPRVAGKSTRGGGVGAPMVVMEVKSVISDRHVFLLRYFAV